MKVMRDPKVTKRLKLSKIAKKAPRAMNGRFQKKKFSTWTWEWAGGVNKQIEDTSVNGRLTSLEAQLKNLKQDYKDIDKIERQLNVIWEILKESNLDKLCQLNNK